MVNPRRSFYEATMERRFKLIDDNYAKAINCDAYCRHYRGFLTQGLMRTHNCKHRGDDGKPCKNLERIPYIDGDRW